MQAHWRESQGTLKQSWHLSGSSQAPVPDAPHQPAVPKRIVVRLLDPGAAG
jgi:hypothetical protein